MVMVEFIFRESYRFSWYIFFVMVMIEFIFRELQPAFSYFAIYSCESQLFRPACFKMQYRVTMIDQDFILGIYHLRSLSVVRGEYISFRMQALFA